MIPETIDWSKYAEPITKRHKRMNAYHCKDRWLTFHALDMRDTKVVNTANTLYTTVNDVAGRYIRVDTYTLVRCSYCHMYHPLDATLFKPLLDSWLPTYKVVP